MKASVKIVSAFISGVMFFSVSSFAQVASSDAQPDAGRKALKSFVPTTISPASQKDLQAMYGVQPRTSKPMPQTPEAIIALKAAAEARLEAINAPILEALHPRISKQRMGDVNVIEIIPANYKDDGSTPDVRPWWWICGALSRLDTRPVGNDGASDRQTRYLCRLHYGSGRQVEHRDGSGHLRL